MCYILLPGRIFWYREGRYRLLSKQKIDYNRWFHCLKVWALRLQRLHVYLRYFKIDIAIYDNLVKQRTNVGPYECSVVGGDGGHSRLYEITRCCKVYLPRWTVQMLVILTHCCRFVEIINIHHEMANHV